MSENVSIYCRLAGHPRWWWRGAVNQLLLVPEMEISGNKEVLLWGSNLFLPFHECFDEDLPVIRSPHGF